MTASSYEELQEKIHALEIENCSLRAQYNALVAGGNTTTQEVASLSFLGEGIPTSIFSVANEDFYVFSYVADIETHEMVFINQAIRSFFGDCVGKKCYNVLHQRATPCPSCNNGLLQDSKQGTDIRESYNKNTKKWYRCIDRLIKTPNGRKLRYEVAIDITDIYKPNVDLAYVRNTFDSLSEGVFLIDNNTGRYLDVNKGGCTLLGFSQEELLAFSSGEIAKHAIPLPTPMLGSRKRYETHCRQRNGEVRFIDLEVCKLTDAPVGGVSVLIARDITTFKQDQRAREVRYLYEHLLASCARELLSQQDIEQTFPRVFGALRQGVDASIVFLVENSHDEQGRLRGCSKQCCLAAHHLFSEGVKADFNIIYDSVLPSWPSTLAKGKSIIVSEDVMSQAEKQLFYVRGIHSALVIPILEHNTWSGFVLFGDVSSEREWFESDINFLKIATEMIGAALERQRTREKLLHSQKCAEEASQAKSLFLANMSHEIRTPLNAVIGLTELSLQEPLSRSVQENLHGVLGSAQALLGIVNDLLDLACVESGKLHRETIPFSPERMVRGIVRLFTRELEQKGLEISCHVDANVPKIVQGDSVRVRQILVNFMGNAAKFTDEGGVYLGVSCVAQSGDSANPNQVFLRFVVQDTGIGIPQERQTAIFESFTQGTEDTNKRYGGTGLGLSISRRLVEMLGGDIGLQSTVGEGSSFWCVLPFLLESTEVEPVAEAATLNPLRDASTPNEITGIEHGTSISVEPLRVLILDADEVCRRGMTASLRLRSHVAMAALDSEQALAWLQEDRFDFIVIDINTIPDALTFVMHIREIYPALPIVYLTSELRSESMQENTSSIDVYIQKPVRGRELCIAIEDAAAQNVNAMWGGGSCAVVTSTEPVLFEDSILRVSLVKRQELYNALPSLRARLESAKDRDERMELRLLVQHIQNLFDGLGVGKAFVLAQRLGERLQCCSAEKVTPLYSLFQDALKQLEHDIAKMNS